MRTSCLEFDLREKCFVFHHSEGSLRGPVGTVHHTEGLSVLVYWWLISWRNAEFLLSLHLLKYPYINIHSSFLVCWYGAFCWWNKHPWLLMWPFSYTAEPVLPDLLKGHLAYAHSGCHSVTVVCKVFGVLVGMTGSRKTSHEVAPILFPEYWV